MFITLASLIFLFSSSLSHANQSIQRVNVHFLVSESLQDEVTKAKKMLRTKGFETIPDTMKPHITVYMSLFKKDQVLELQKLLTPLCKRKPIKTKTSGWSLTKNRWFFLDIEKSREVMDFHNQVVSQLAPLRDPSANEIPDFVKELYPDRIPTIKKIGSVYAGPYFDPHFSLLTWKHSKGVEKFMAENPRKKPINGLLHGLALAVANEDGQFKKAIWTCEFKKN